MSNAVFDTVIEMPDGMQLFTVGVANGIGNPIAFLLPSLAKGSLVRIHGMQLVVDHCELEVDTSRIRLHIVVERK